MSFVLPTNLDDIQEDKIMPGGYYNLRIKSAVIKDAKKEYQDTGRKLPLLFCVIEFEDEPDAKAIMLNMILPNDLQNENAAKMNLQSLKRFIQSFNVPIDPANPELDPNTLPGLVAELEVASENDPTYGESNVIRWPKIRD